MRFTWNSFIVSTVTLLALITPVVNAVDNVAKITVPKAGAVLNVDQSVNVVWYVRGDSESERSVSSEVIDGGYYCRTIPDSERNLVGVACNMALLHVGTAPVSQGPKILASGVLIQSGAETVTIPKVESKNTYYLALISGDQATTYAKSGVFSIT